MRACVLTFDDESALQAITFIWQWFMIRVKKNDLSLGWTATFDRSFKLSRGKHNLIIMNRISAEPQDLRVKINDSSTD